MKLGESPPPLALVAATAPAEPTRRTLVRRLRDLPIHALRGAFVVGLVVYLAHALGARGYGVFARAVAVATVAGYPLGIALPVGVWRLVSARRDNPRHAYRVAATALRIQLPLSLGVGLGLFVGAGAIAHAYALPSLVWPLRWAAVAMVAQGVFAVLTAVTVPVGGTMPAEWPALCTIALQVTLTVEIVVMGGGAAGATLARSAAYAIAAAAALGELAPRLIRPGLGLPSPAALRARVQLLQSRLRARLRPGLASRPRRPLRSWALPWRRQRCLPPRARGRQVGLTVTGVVRQGATALVVDLVRSAILPMEAILTAAIVDVSAVGRFGAAVALAGVLGPLGLTAGIAIAPRLTLIDAAPGRMAFQSALRYLILGSGLLLAPMVVWASPIVDGLLGRGFAGSAPILRALAPYAVMSGPAMLIAITVSQLDRVRNRLAPMAGLLAGSGAASWALIRALGVEGAAVGMDLTQLVILAAYLLAAGSLIAWKMSTTVCCAGRALLGAGAMALVLLAVGHSSSLSAAQWTTGAVGGVAAFIGVLLATGEISRAEPARLVALLRGDRSGAVPAAPPPPRAAL